MVKLYAPLMSNETFFYLREAFRHMLGIEEIHFPEIKLHLVIN